MTKPGIVTIDFETEGIQDRPRYPPKPVGLAIKRNGARGKYITDMGVAKQMLQDVWRSGDEVLCHNGKFDFDVAQKHLGLEPLPWHRIHDTLFSLFLDDPHASTLSLKPSAERLLGWKPEEQDAVKEWILANVKEATPKTAGAFICKAPVALVKPYALGDVDRTYALHKHLLPTFDSGMREAYDRERKLLQILLDNERAGLRVDLDRLEQDLKVYEAALLKVDLWLRKALRAPGLNLDADADVAAALKKVGVVKEFPKTPTGRDSVSKKVLTLAFFSKPMIWYALYYRNALVTCLSMSMRPWFKQGSECNGRIFTEWNQVRQSHGEKDFKGARSGRITCSRFQNITKDFLDRGDDYGATGDSKIRAEIGLPALPLVRKYILPDDGELFGHIDYNQQEMRLVAHYEDGALALAYRNDPKMDVHTFVQGLIKSVTGKHYERRPVKIVDFRTVYGGGASGLADGLKWPLEQAQELIRAWKQALPDVVALDRDLKDAFYAGDAIRTWGGRLYHCKPPSVAKKGARKGQLISFEYTALNYKIQPSGADITKQAIIDYHDHPKRDSRMLVTVHDELNVSLPKGKEVQQLAVLRECMEQQKIDVPWQSESKLGRSWGELQKLGATK